MSGERVEVRVECGACRGAGKSPSLAYADSEGNHEPWPCGRCGGTGGMPAFLTGRDALVYQLGTAMLRARAADVIGQAQPSDAAAMQWLQASAEIDDTLAALEQFDRSAFADAKEEGEG